MLNVIELHFDRESKVCIYAYLDVNDISEPVSFQVGRQMFDSLLFVSTGEHVASTATVTFGIRHLEMKSRLK